VVDPIDQMQNLHVSSLFTLVGALSARIKALEDVLAIKADGSIVLSGRDIEIKASGKITIKAGGHLVLKGAKILQN
jgi:uncharacterized protein (DUF2345 family)